MTEVCLFYDTRSVSRKPLFSGHLRRFRERIFRQTPLSRNLERPSGDLANPGFIIESQPVGLQSLAKPLRNQISPSPDTHSVNPVFAKRVGCGGKCGCLRCLRWIRKDGVNRTFRSDKNCWGNRNQLAAAVRRAAACFGDPLYCGGLSAEIYHLARA